MATMARWCFQRRVWVLIGWLSVIVGLTNGESLTWEEILAGSGSVGGRLIASALICGSHRLGEPDNAVSTPMA